MLSGHLAVDTFQKCGNPKREWKIALGGGGYFEFIPPFENKIF